MALNTDFCVKSLAAAPSTCDETITADLTCDAAPDNPCLVGVTAESSTSDPCTFITAQTLAVKSGSTVLQGVSLPLQADVIDLADYAGQTVTLCYDVSYSCGAEVLTEELECTVNVPAFTADLTVNPAQPASATNFQTIGDGMAALPSGGRLNIAPGTYPLGTGGEATRLDANNKANACILGEGAILDATNSTAQGIVRTNSASTNTLIRGVEVNSADRWGFFLNSSTDVVLDGISVSGVTRTIPVGTPGSTPNAIGVYFFQGQGSSLLNSTITQVSGSAVQAIQGADDILIDGNQMLGDPVNPLDGIRDGVLTEDSTNVTITNNIMRDGFRSGIISTGAGQADTLIQNCEITGWVAAGVQIENEASLQVIRQNFIARCNTYITGGGGESGIWLDDCNRCLVDGNTVTECDTGLRNSANGVGSSVLANVDNIFRGNLVFNNNANFSGLLNGDEDSLGTRHSVRGYYYGNTFDANGNSSNQGFNGIAMRIHTFGTPSSDNFFVNNIVSNILPNTAGIARTVKFDLAGAEFARLDGNVYFNGPPNAYELGGGLHPTFAGYQAALLGLGHEQNSVEADPLLDANYVPQAGGAAFGNAVDLVQITSVAGTTIGLDYPGVFWVGDYIEFADGSKAEITAVNATSIEVDGVPASVAAGQGATLYTCNGSDDVGAIQVP